MKQVVVGSNNPVKLAATKAAFAQSFGTDACQFLTHAAPSGVPDQPLGSAETKRGAQNRAAACREAHPEADFFVGIEGGLEKIDDAYWAFAWMCVQDAAGTCGFGRSGSFLLPHKVSELIDRGEELGTAADTVFREVNSKQKGGTVAILTNGAVTRKDFYTDAMVFALIPFLKPELYA